MSGPLPDPNARRRNAPTIPTTNLPLSGRGEPAPDIPAWASFREAGLAWWEWAWSTPQASGWSEGDMAVIARRAALEDDIALLDEVDNIDTLAIADAEAMRQVREIVGRLAALATGRMTVCREMRELDNLLGLTPKGMAALRWKIVDDTKATTSESKGNVTSIADRRQRLVANDS